MGQQICSSNLDQHPEKLSNQNTGEIVQTKPINLYNNQQIIHEQELVKSKEIEIQNLKKSLQDQIDLKNTIISKKDQLIRNQEEILKDLQTKNQKKDNNVNQYYKKFCEKGWILTCLHEHPLKEVWIKEPWQCDAITDAPDKTCLNNFNTKEKRLKVSKLYQCTMNLNECRNKDYCEKCAEMYKI